MSPFNLVFISSSYNFGEVGILLEIPHPTNLHIMYIFQWWRFFVGQNHSVSILVL